MFLKGLQTNRHGNRNLIKKNERHIANKYFAGSILGGFLHVCQIVIDFDVLIFYGIAMHFFGDVIFMDL